MGMDLVRSLLTERAGGFCSGGASGCSNELEVIVDFNTPQFE
jgi:hypothetical protein